MVVVWILGILFISLIIIVPLIERFGPRMSQESLAKMSRWVLPLVALLLVVQLIARMF